VEICGKGNAVGGQQSTGPHHVRSHPFDPLDNLELLVEPYLPNTCRRKRVMAYLIQVMCVARRSPFDPGSPLHSIGGVNPDGTKWRLTEQEAILGIEQGRWIFYVERPFGDRVEVIVARGPLGNQYLKTEADAERPNNLLSLPNCI